ncbi:hypothetical protein PENTCL1PPCAC_20786, partial [Pristionchus entomophagus]
YQYIGKYPRGPWPLPFIGNYLDFDFKAQYRSFTKIGKSQASIYTLFTPAPYVQITDFKLIKEAYVENGDVFVDRPTNLVIQEAFAFGHNAG